MANSNTATTTIATTSTTTTTTSGNIQMELIDCTPNPPTKDRVITEIRVITEMRVGDSEKTCRGKANWRRCV